MQHSCNARPKSGWRPDSKMVSFSTRSKYYLLLFTLISSNSSVVCADRWHSPTRNLPLQHFREDLHHVDDHSRRTSEATSNLSRGGSLQSLRVDNNGASVLSPSEHAVNGDGVSAVNSADIEQQDVERVKLVKLVLSQRLAYVAAGKRAKDIAQWMKQNRHERSIIDAVPETTERSQIAVDDSTILNGTTTSMEIEVDSQLLKRLQRDPFPSDRLNLDIDEHAATAATATHTTSTSATPSIWQLGFRMLQLSYHFAPVLSTIGLAVVHKPFRQHVWYKWLTTSIGCSGPAFVKWAQWSSTRNDMFPEALCDHLATLQAAAPAHSWSFSKSSVEQSLGLREGMLEYVFDQFDERPLASGSIAQVHKAVLCGVPVAVKIRHPRVVQLMDIDFRLMTRAASLMDMLPALSWLHIRETVTQFSYSIAAQAYLQVEAHHLEVLNHNFRRWPKVGFPIPFYASASVIIETFERGRIASAIIDGYDKLATNARNENLSIESGLTVIESEEENGDERASDALDEVRIEGYDIMPLDLARFMVSTGVGLYLKMLLVDNLMHADLHGGNIMVDAEYSRKRHLLTTGGETALEVRQSPSAWNQAQSDAISAMNDEMGKIHITIVDAGMVATLTDEESSAFIGLLSSLGEGDGNEAAEYTLQFSAENNLTEEQRKLFAADMVTLFAERCRGYGTGVDVGEVLRGVLGLIRKHRVRIDGNFATLVINCLCIESMARRSCPNYNVLDAGRPLFQCYRRFKKKSKGKNPLKLPFFGASMALSALKKDFDDKAFFREEAKRQLRRQNVIVENMKAQLQP